MLTHNFSMILNQENNPLITIVEQAIMNSIEELNGVSILIGILNAFLIKSYNKGWINNEMTDKILYYLKKLINQDIVEETYRDYLIKRIQYLGKIDFTVEKTLLDHMEKLFGLKATY